VNDVTERVRLEPCHVHVEPPMKPEVERLTYPAELAESLTLDVAVGESGLTISGWAFDILCCFTTLSLIEPIKYFNIIRSEPILAYTLMSRKICGILQT